jgi:hypothetical protein
MYITGNGAYLKIKYKDYENILVLYSYLGAKSLLYESFSELLRNSGKISDFKVILEIMQ